MQKVRQEIFSIYFCWGNLLGRGRKCLFYPKHQNTIWYVYVILKREEVSSLKYYLINKSDGYVADYNPEESSCEWVQNYRNAHKFWSEHDAKAARHKLDLGYAVIIEVGS